MRYVWPKYSGVDNNSQAYFGSGKLKRFLENLSMGLMKERSLSEMIPRLCVEFFVVSTCDRRVM